MRTAEYVVERIVDKRKVEDTKDQYEYLVHWEGYDTDDETWENWDSIKHLTKQLKEFENTVLTPTKKQSGKVTGNKRRRANKPLESDSDSNLEDEEYEVESVLAIRKLRGKDAKPRKEGYEFQIKWKGTDEVTWEPYENVKENGQAEALLQQELNKSQRKSTENSVAASESDEENEETIEYEVESVISVRKKRGKESKAGKEGYEFRIKWKNYDEITWEPYEHVRDNEQAEAMIEKVLEDKRLKEEASKKRVRRVKMENEDGGSTSSVRVALRRVCRK